jgi:exonuclease SbcD
LVAHQFVTGAKRSDSEDINVGGVDNIDGALFEPFDYVALGHIHRPQWVWKNTVRYCGTPLKYSFSEANHNKSISVVNIKEKGNLEFYEIPLIPYRDLREIKDTYWNVTDRNQYCNTNIQDYIHITLTDEEDIPDAIGKLRSIYPNIMKLDYDNTRTRTMNIIETNSEIERKTDLELFAEFYFLQNNQELTEEQKNYTKLLLEKTRERER